jgi:hypothetical protein
VVTWSVPLKLHCSLIGAFPFAAFRRTSFARVRSSSVRLLAALLLRLDSAMDYRTAPHL